MPLNVDGYVDPFALARDNGGSILPNALVTGAPDRVPDIAIALKSAGFDILTAGTMSADEAARFLPLLAPDTAVLLLTEDAGRRADAGGSAEPRPPEPSSPPWWRYADIDPDLGFADWRNSVFCLGSIPNR